MSERSHERSVISMAVMAMHANERFDEETAERLLQVFDAGYAALEAKLERMDAVLKELANLANDGERHDFGGPHISIPWVLDRFAQDDLASLPTQQKPTEEGMERA